MTPRGTRSSQGTVSVNKRGAVAYVTINRPYAGNAIDASVRDGLIAAVSAIGADPGIRVIVLFGAGEEAFSTGLDLAELATLSPEDAAALALHMRKVCEALLMVDVIIIAAVKGGCIGAGFEVALHCDIRIARGDARFGFPGINLGLVPGAAGIERLTRIAGVGPAHALYLTGGIISAERAFMLGVITNVFNGGDFDAGVTEFAEHLASLPAVATKELKALLKSSAKGMIAPEEGAQAFARCFADGDAGERLRAMFAGPEPGTAVH